MHFCTGTRMRQSKPSPRRLHDAGDADLGQRVVEYDDGAERDRSPN